MAKGTTRRTSNKMSAEAKAEANEVYAQPLPDPIARAEEEGKINFDTDAGDAEPVQHNEPLSDVGNATAMAEALDQELIVPREVTPEQEGRTRMAQESTDYVENGAAPDPKDLKKNSGTGAARGKVGALVQYHTKARRAGIRNSDARAAIITGLNDDGTVSLTVFDVNRIDHIRRVGSNKNMEEYWQA